jgi:hypothetical protein
MVLQSCSKSDERTLYIQNAISSLSQLGSQVDSAKLNPEVSVVSGVVWQICVCLAPTKKFFGIRKPAVSLNLDLRSLPSSSPSPQSSRYSFHEQSPAGSHPGEARTGEFHCSWFSKNGYRTRRFILFNNLGPDVTQ